jgi:hypothetical protein
MIHNSPGYDFSKIGITRNVEIWDSRAAPRSAIARVRSRFIGTTSALAKMLNQASDLSISRAWFIAFEYFKTKST